MKNKVSAVNVHEYSRKSEVSDTNRPELYYQGGGTLPGFERGMVGVDHDTPHSVRSRHGSRVCADRLPPGLLLIG